MQSSDSRLELDLLQRGMEHESAGLSPASSARPDAGVRQEVGGGVTEQCCIHIDLLFDLFGWFALRRTGFFISPVCKANPFESFAGSARPFG